MKITDRDLKQLFPQTFRGPKGHYRFFINKGRVRGALGLCKCEPLAESEKYDEVCDLCGRNRFRTD